MKQDVNYSAVNFLYEQANKTTKKSVRTADKPAEIQTRCLVSKNLEHRYISLLSGRLGWRW